MSEVSREPSPLSLHLMCVSGKNRNNHFLFQQRQCKPSHSRSQTVPPQHRKAMCIRKKLEAHFQMAQPFTTRNLIAHLLKSNQLQKQKKPCVTYYPNPSQTLILQATYRGLTVWS